MLKRVVDGALLGFALMLFEIGLKLLLGFDGVGYEFPLNPECQFADIAIGGARSAPDKLDDSELPVRHRDIMAGRSRRVKCAAKFRTTELIANL
jgi:hypothetical protein